MPWWHPRGGDEPEKTWRHKGFWRWVSWQDKATDEDQKHGFLSWHNGEPKGQHERRAERETGAKRSWWRFKLFRWNDED